MKIYHYFADGSETPSTLLLSSLLVRIRDASFFKTILWSQRGFVVRVEAGGGGVELVEHDLGVPEDILDRVFLTNGTMYGV